MKDVERRKAQFQYLPQREGKHHFTQIGSLPHAQVDAAIEYSFRHSIPFLPQLPLRNPKEYMAPQALFRFPGFFLKPGGYPVIDLKEWSAKSYELRQSLSNTMRSLPTHSEWACFAPFLWELEERKSTFAKLQAAGPFTVLSLLQCSDGTSLFQQGVHLDLVDQISQYLKHAALQWSLEFKRIGVQPLFFIDEPQLSGLSSETIHQALRFETGPYLAIRALKDQILALQEAGVLVGIHCCGQGPWRALIDLNPDVISLDTHLSLKNLFQESQHNHHQALKDFLNAGGRLALGAVPTSKSQPSPLANWNELLVYFNSGEPLFQKALNEAIITPSCGLALTPIEECESILQVLQNL